ncbi:MAG TPA: carboxypeptidase-like regulatory domain-containing protein [Gemmata sp.]
MRALVLCAGFLALVPLLGCGGGPNKPNPYPTSNVPVSGRVVGPTGHPIRGGASVTLSPAAKGGAIFGKAGTGTVGADGTFKLKTEDGTDGIPGGFYTVTVYPHGSDAGAKGAATRAIPKRPWSDETSDLTVEIKEGEVGWELKLTK